jgi:transcription elongation GreA/GreB family factor
MSLPSKRTILDAFATHVAARLDATAAITAMARDEATNEETRPENKYDTRALEASYLAAGQGRRLADLRQLAAWLDALPDTPHRAAGPGSVIVLAHDERTRCILLAPQGGECVVVEEVSVELIGLRSPLGRAVVGLEEDDEAVVQAPRGTTHWTLLAVH